MPDVKVSGDDVMLGHYRQLFQVTIGDVTVGVFSGHESVLDVLGKGGSPGVGSPFFVEEDASRPGLGSVSCPHNEGFLRHEFGQVSGPAGQ